MALVLSLAALAQSACAREQTRETGFLEISRPDGVLIVYQKEWWEDRYRAPMDHGSDQTTLAVVYQAFLYPANGSEPRPVPLDLVADYENGDPSLRPDLPILTWTEQGLEAEVCRETTAMALDCGDDRAASIAQVRGRIEDAALADDVLTLANGPDGSANCRIDLETIVTDITPPKTEMGFDPGPRWKLAHFPGRGSYLLDEYDPGRPLYLLTCGHPPKKLTDLREDPSGGWIEIIDVAPTANPANPRVLYSTRVRFEEAILRDMTSEIWASKVGALKRSDVGFLDQEGDRLILSSDWLFRKTPGLTLKVLDIASGAQSELSWEHPYADWSARPRQDP